MFYGKKHEETLLSGVEKGKSCIEESIIKLNF